MPPSAPLIAVVGAPDLVSPVSQAGLTMLTPDTDVRAIRQALKTAREADPGRVVILLVGRVDDRARAWVATQVGRQTAVIVLASDQLPVLDGIPGARTAQLPSTIDEIFAVLGFPGGRGPGGAVRVEADATVVTPDAPAPQPEPDLFGASMWDDTAPAVAPAQPDHEDFAEDDFPAPRATPRADTAPVVTTPTLAAADDDFDDDDFGTPSPAAQPVHARHAAPAGMAHAPTRVAVLDPEHVQPAQTKQTYTPPRPVVIDTDYSDVVTTHPVGNDGTLADVVVVIGAKGGIGKSSTAMTMAERAAHGHVERVGLMDGSRGQGDQLKYLRLTKSNLPTIYDAVLAGKPRAAIIDPNRLNAARGPLPGLGFGVVLAPRAGQADPNVVTSAAYRDQVEELRRVSRLVVIDTQIMESHDTSGLFDEVWLPLLRQPGVWGVHVTDSSVAGMTNVTERLLTMHKKSGIDAARTMVFANRVPPNAPVNLDLFRQRIGSLAEFVGVVHESLPLYSAIQSGRVPHGRDPELAAVLDRVLFRVTGLPSFDPQRPGAAQPNGGKRAGILGRLRAGAG